MATNFRDLVDAFPPERRARIDARKAELMEEEAMRRMMLDSQMFGCSPGFLYAPAGKPDVTPSCGCIFCDLDLPPEKMKRQWIHHIPSQGRIVVCDVKNLKPRS